MNKNYFHHGRKAVEKTESAFSRQTAEGAEPAFKIVSTPFV
jgi:hypothetical protein